jgi:hypothetical protein
MTHDTAANHRLKATIRIAAIGGPRAGKMLQKIDICVLWQGAQARCFF